MCTLHPLCMRMQPEEKHQSSELPYQHPALRVLNVLPLGVVLVSCMPCRVSQLLPIQAGLIFAKIFGTRTRGRHKHRECWHDCTVAVAMPWQKVGPERKQAFLDLHAISWPRSQMARERVQEEPRHTILRMFSSRKELVSVGAFIMQPTVF